MHEHTRREFFRRAAILGGAAGAAQLLPQSIQKALAIDPAPGSTFLDAEHVVILMQENRSFDHSYGTLQGVRGFNGELRRTESRRHHHAARRQSCVGANRPRRQELRALPAEHQGHKIHVDGLPAARVE